MKTQWLPVALTDVELRERGDRLASIFDEKVVVEFGKKAASDAAKDRISALDEEAGTIVREIRQKTQSREVEVEDVEDFEALMVKTVRKDTRETVSHRGMTPEERQRALPFGKGAKKTIEKAAE